MYKQDYEKVWDKYSDNFDDKKNGAEHLGDEWSTPEKSLVWFKKFIEPYLQDVAVAGELGVGGGKYSVLAADHIKKLYGIDISNNMLARTKERLADHECVFVPAKCENSEIPLPDESIEFFYSLDSMVHIFPYELYLYILEVGRILKPEGVAILEFADWDTPAAIVKFKLDVEVFQKNGGLGSGAFGFVSRQAIHHFANEAGLKVENIEAMTGRTSVARLRKSNSLEN